MMYLFSPILWMVMAGFGLGAAWSLGSIVLYLFGYFAVYKAIKEWDAYWQIRERMEQAD